LRNRKIEKALHTQGHRPTSYRLGSKVMSVTGEAGYAEEEAAGRSLIAPVAERGYLRVARALQTPVIDTGKEVTEFHGFG
jgi:hypothetical protein